MSAQILLPLLVHKVTMSAHDMAWAYPSQEEEAPAFLGEHKRSPRATEDMTRCLRHDLQSLKSQQNCAKAEGGGRGLMSHHGPQHLLGSRR